jgi:hypothetical protein
MLMACGKGGVGEGKKERGRGCSKGGMKDELQKISQKTPTRKQLTGQLFT